MRQVLDDPARVTATGRITAEIDLTASDERGEAVVWVTTVEPLGGPVAPTRTHR